MIVPSQIELNGERYRVAVTERNPYSEWTESIVVQDPDIAGASRASKNPRPDILTWKLDDWSAGEGRRFYVSEDPLSKRMYFTSDPIDVILPGQVELGLATTDSFDAGSVPGNGPYLTRAGGNVWVAWDSSTNEETADDTWTSRTSGMGSEVIVGPVSAIGGNVYIAGVRNAGNGGLVRVNSSGATQWAAVSMRSPLVADSRVYALARGAESSLLRRTALSPSASAPFTPTTMATFDGIGSSNQGSPLQSVSIGSKIYSLLSNDGESTRLWVLEDDVGSEAAVFEGLFVDNDEPGIQCLAVVNGIVFAGGWETRNDGKTRGRLDFYNAQNNLWGTVGSLAHDDSLASTNRFSAIAPGRKNELILLARTNGDAYRYDLRTGGLSKFLEYSNTSAEKTSATFWDGKYYIAQAASSGTIERSLTSGTGKYIASATITQSIWDFDLPDTEKLLTEIEVHTDTLPTDTSVEVQVVLDGTTTVTTDSAGTTMSHASGTRTKFTVSDADTERVFRYCQPKVLLKTSDTSATPTLYSVTLRSVAAEKVTFYEALIDLRDESADSRKVGQQKTGRKQLATLRTLRDATSNRLFTFTPLFTDSKSPYPHPSDTQATVTWAPNDRSTEFEGRSAGEGLFRVRLMKVG